MIPSLPAFSFLVLFRSRAVLTAVRALRVPAARCTDMLEVPLTAGVFLFAAYPEILSSQNLSSRFRASCSPHGQKDRNLVFSSSVSDLFGGRSGMAQSKSLANSWR